jgi:predicted HD phosphohydrolase
LQGGPFDPVERAEFERIRWYRESVALRRWDDLAKVPGMNVPGLDHYRDRLAKTIQRTESIK